MIIAAIIAIPGRLLRLSRKPPPLTLMNTERAYAALSDEELEGLRQKWLSAQRPEAKPIVEIKITGGDTQFREWLKKMIRANPPGGAE